MKFENLSLDIILDYITRGDLRVIDYIYDTYRQDFLNWAQRKYPSANHDDLLDAWQETMVMFYEQVRDRKLTYLTCEIKTFLFLIGSRRLMNMFRKTDRVEYVEEFDVNINMIESINEMKYELHNEEELEFIRQAIDKMPAQSRQILTLRFLHGKSIEEILQIMNYSSDNAVSAALSRALKNLKDIILKQTQGSPPWKS
jgi:RNA polymerase sigma factor (sigma-70 family)